MHKSKTAEMTKICMLAGLIAVTGMIKIPAPIPGAEFQLSAPIAVAIAAVYGFRRYLTAGILASVLMLMTGQHNLLNVEIAMIFRVVAGGVASIFPLSLPALLLAGPLGTIAARIGLATSLHLDPWPLILSSIPGMIFTMALVIPTKKILNRSEQVVMRYGQSRNF